MSTCIAGLSDENFPSSGSQLFCDKGGLLQNLKVVLSKGLGVTLESQHERCSAEGVGNKSINYWSGNDDYSTSCYDAALASIRSQCDNKPSCSPEFDVTTCPALTSGDNYYLSVQGDCGGGGLDSLTILSLLLIMFIALALGCTLTVESFKEVMSTKKRAFFIGFASQFGFMPFMSWALAQAFGFSNLVATGVVLCGSAPGGSTSNLFTYWSRGNVALSIAMSSASTVCALFMLPLLILIYVSSTFQGSGEDEVKIPFANIVISLLAIVVPVLVGTAIRKWDKDCCLFCKKNDQNGNKVTMKVHEVVEKVGGALGALFLVAAAASGIKANPELFDISEFWKVWLLAALFQPLGGGFGLIVSKFAKLSGPDSRAVCLETGVQSYALILAIVNLSYQGCARSEVLTFVLVATFWYVLSSFWMVSALRFTSERMDALYGKGEDEIMEKKEEEEEEDNAL